MSGIIIKLYMKIEEKVGFVSNFPKRKRFTFHSFFHFTHVFGSQPLPKKLIALSYINI